MTDYLKVLEMSEEEQWKWLEKKYGAGAFHSFPTLAFRLRDEATSYNWNRWLDSTKEVWKKEHKYWTYEQFWMGKAKPIHWIIAALIAKEKEDA